MTFPEFLAYNATWFDRLRCRIAGHVPLDALGLRLAVIQGSHTALCGRCGSDLRTVMTLLRAVATGEMTPEAAAGVLVRRSP